MTEQHEYTQGICEDGAAILCDGVAMRIEQILAGLQERDRLAEQNGELEKREAERKAFIDDALIDRCNKLEAQNAELVERINVAIKLIKNCESFTARSILSKAIAKAEVTK